MNSRLIWFKGKLSPAEEATVHALSPTAQFGLNVFEGLRGYWNPDDAQLYVFRVKDHLDRLAMSCKLIGLEMPYTHEEIEEFMRDTIAGNDYKEDVALRMTVFVDDEGTWSTVRKPDMFIAPIAKARKSLETWRGLSATISSWRRIDDVSLPPRIKCGANYINGRYAHLDAQRKGFDLPIFLGADNKLSEGAGACLFLVRDGALITPTGTSSILESITRDTLINLARKMGMDVQVRAVDRTEMLIADEAFLCGSAAELTPVTSVDHMTIGSGDIEPVTTALAQAYFEAVSKPDPAYPDWHWAAYTASEGNGRSC